MEMNRVHSMELEARVFCFECGYPLNGVDSYVSRDSGYVWIAFPELCDSCADGGEPYDGPTQRAWLKF